GALLGCGLVAGLIWCVGAKMDGPIQTWQWVVGSLPGLALFGWLSYCFPGQLSDLQQLGSRAGDESAKTKRKPQRSERTAETRKQKNRAEARRDPPSPRVDDDVEAIELGPEDVFDAEEIDIGSKNRPPRNDVDPTAQKPGGATTGTRERESPRDPDETSG